MICGRTKSYHEKRSPCLVGINDRRGDEFKTKMGKENEAKKKSI